MSYKKSWRISLVIVLVLMMALGTSLTGFAVEFDPVFEENWDGRGTDSEKFYVPDSDDPRFELYDETGGWIHWVFNTKGDSTDAKLVLGGTGSGEYAPGEPLNANVWHFYTPYFELEGLAASIYLNGEPGSGGGLVISDFRKPVLTENLTVTKTAETSYTRKHLWDIDKIVETENEYTIDGIPKIWLYIDGSGNETATWTVDVTYEEYKDYNHVVSGEVTIENTGQLDAEITDIKDYLAGNLIDVDFGEEFDLPYTLEVGEKLIGTYSEEVDNKIEGKNVVTVITERDEYKAEANIIWSEVPKEEINKSVKVMDFSDLFGKVYLGKVSAPNDREFTYTKEFKWEDYGLENGGSFEYNNVAKIVETGQKAEATLKVNVQEYIYESAWAKGEQGIANSFTENGFNNWGWSNKIAEGYEGSWTLWAGAGQSNTSNGTDVGNVKVSYENGELEVVIELHDGYVQIGEEHVYADNGMFPTLRNGRATVAPGQYYIAKDLSGEIYVIVHAVVGLPDPNFGPQ